MRRKKRNVRRILAVMKRYNITINDLSRENELQKQKFDLLCEHNGRRQRVPYKKGSLPKKVIGIFPFADSPVYLELTEHEALRSEVRSENLPTIDFMERLSELRSGLNTLFKLLKTPLLNGSYHAKSNNGSEDINWVLCFCDLSTETLLDHFDGDVVAKVRYIGSYPV